MVKLRVRFRPRLQLIRGGWWTAATRPKQLPGGRESTPLSESSRCVNFQCALRVRAILPLTRWEGSRLWPVCSTGSAREWLARVPIGRPISEEYPRFLLLSSGLNLLFCDWRQVAFQRRYSPSEWVCRGQTRQTMRCSAYEGCPSRRGVAGLFSFLKSFLVFLSRFFLRTSRIARRAPLPSPCPVLSRSPAPIRASAPRTLARGPSP